MVSSPAVYNGTAYVGSEDHKLYAFDAAGSTNCSGTPTTCAPLWTGNTGDVIDSSPAVDNGVVYVGSNDGKLYAFDAAGSTNCSGTPKTCAPLWTGTTGGAVDSSPTVVNGVVYVGSEDHKLYAFDAAGSINCSGTPKTCAPLWTSAPMGNATNRSSPAVVNGVVYIGVTTSSPTGPFGSTVFTSDLSAFDAAGSTNCSGTPKVCAPLWTAALGSGVDFVSSDSSPAVADGSVFVGAGKSNLDQYDAAGIINCSGTPKVCSATAGYATAGGGDPSYHSSPAIADGWAYIGSQTGLQSYNLSGPPTPWTGGTGGAVDSSPAVANGVVYVGADDGRLYAFAAGSTNGFCGGSLECAPLWEAITGGPVESSPAVANGMVYVGSNDGKLHVYGLP